MVICTTYMETFLFMVIWLKHNIWPPIVHSLIKLGWWQSVNAFSDYFLTFYNPEWVGSFSSIRKCCRTIEVYKQFSSSTFQNVPQENTIKCSKTIFLIFIRKCWTYVWNKTKMIILFPVALNKTVYHCYE